MAGQSNGEDGVLDVKPLRSLAPMFPAPLGFNAFTQSNDPPFVCVNPFGSVPPRSEAFPDFFPFATPNVNKQKSPPSRLEKSPRSNGVIHATPLSAFPTPGSSSFHAIPEVFSESEDEDSSYSEQMTSFGRRTKRPSYLGGGRGSNSGKSDLGGDRGSNSAKTAKRNRDDRSVKIDVALLPSSLSDPRESVEVTLMAFDAFRRRLQQLEEATDASRRPDLRAAAIMMEKNFRANSGKRTGPVPGIEIGDIFYFRMELCVVGLHAPSMAGIDYMTCRFDDKEDPVAICVVSSGGYENEDDDVDVLIYSGQGGGAKHDKKKPDDQKLERGNLALERSTHRNNEIRVIRSVKDMSCQTGKIYIYDGIYKIEKAWTERSKAGFNVFKYKLLRQPGQPDGIAVWKLTQRWKENPSSRGKVILPDISSGAESIPICLVNEIDDDRGPDCFTYITEVKYLNPISSMKPLQGCICPSVCLPGDINCMCAQKHGGDLPYSSNGLLVSRKPLIYECSSSCRCSSNCRNRVTQKGIKFHFEVFKTRERGWGLRSWDPIRAGTFICEFTGEVINEAEFDDNDGEVDDYIFRATQPGEKALKWNFGPELIGETQNPSESFKSFPIIINAKNSGNISRFMNHSCSPNVFWQPVQHDHDDERYPHIMFFALKHIPPMTELTYDYGLREAESDKQEMRSLFETPTSKKCLCGSPNCRGVFG